MFSFFTGRKFCNEIAVHLGIPKSVYSSALLESGVTWFHLKVIKKSGASVQEASDELMPAFSNGLLKMTEKFGMQPEITQASEVVARWLEERVDQC